MTTDTSMLRVALVTHYFPAHQGGVESVAGQIARRMIERGAEITWVSSGVDEPPKDVVGLRSVPIRATNIVERRMHLPYPIWSIRDLAKLWRSVGGADLVHVHDFIYMGSLLAVLFAKLRRKPVVITQHIGFIPYESRVARTVLQGINRTFGALVLSSADRVIFISRTVEEYFASFTRFRRAPYFIPNGVASDVYAFKDGPSRRRIRARLGISDAQFVLLFVGRFVEKKGLPFLRALVLRNSNCTWLFAGAGPLDPQQWGLPNVAVLRGLSGHSLAEIYAAADLLILPSKGEGFPLVVQEAMSCGTPAFLESATVAAFPGISAHIFAESVSDAGALDKWSQAIQRLTNNPREISDMRTVVASFSRKHWSWDVCVRQYLDIFADCIAGKYMSSR